MKEIKEIIQSSNPKNPNSDKMKGWKMKTLGDISEIMNGGTPDTTVPKFWDGENLWITPKDMGKLENIYVDDTLRKITDEGLKNSSAKILPPNSIILSSRAPIGHLAINTKPISTNQGCKGLVPKKGVDTLFLYYFLLKSVDLLNSLGTGATFKELSGSKLGTVEIHLPPLPEQQRIVSILDECFSAIAKAKANAEQNLKNAKEVFESYLQGVFGGSTGSPTKRDGWEEKKLGEIALIKGGKRVPKGYKLEYENTNHPYIRVADFNDYGSIDLNDIRYVNDNVFNEIKNYTISKNDLYLSIAGTIGKTGIVPDELDGANLTENACKLVFKENIDKKFVYYFTKTESFKIQTGLNTRTAAMPKLALTRLASIKFHVPKLIQTQNDFVQKFDAISAETQKLEAVYQKKLDDLEELKKSVLKRAFAGEL